MIWNKEAHEVSCNKIPQQVHQTMSQEQKHHCLSPRIAWNDQLTNQLAGREQGRTIKWHIKMSFIIQTNRSRSTFYSEIYRQETREAWRNGTMTIRMLAKSETNSTKWLKALTTQDSLEALVWKQRIIEIEMTKSWLWIHTIPYWIRHIRVKPLLQWCSWVHKSSRLNKGFRRSSSNSGLETLSSSLGRSNMTMKPSMGEEQDQVALLERVKPWQSAIGTRSSLPRMTRHRQESCNHKAKKTSQRRGWKSLPRSDTRPYMHMLKSHPSPQWPTEQWDIPWPMAPSADSQVWQHGRS